jgi:hypothetical protein
LPLARHETTNHFEGDFLPKLRDRGVTILDPVPLLQARTKSIDIIPFDEGGCFYRDGTHLSVYGALALKPLFAPVIRQSRDSLARSRKINAN